MRIKHKVNVKIADDTDMKDLLFSFDDTLAEVVIDNYERQVSGKFTIPATTNEDLPTGDITAIKGGFIKVDSDVVIKINGSSDGISLVKGGSASDARFFIEATLTAINITAGAAAAAGTYCFWGDASA